MPLNKTKIITVNIESENKVTLGEALLKAVQGFNKIDKNYRITEKVNLYKLRYSKKSGLPDMDIPRKNFYFKYISVRFKSEIIKSQLFVLFCVNR